MIMPQLLLTPPDELDLLPLDSGNYVAALQNRAGELDALQHASDAVWERTMPLMQFVGEKVRSTPLLKPTISTWMKNVHAALGFRPFFLDVVRLNPTFPVAASSGNVPVLEQMYIAARRRGLRFVPVVWAGESSSQHRELVRDAAFADGHGLALRTRILRGIPPGEATWVSILKDELSETCRVASEVDLIVDLEYLDPDMEIDVPDMSSWLRELVEVDAWRSVILLGTSIPSTMSCISEGTLGSLPRREWDLWLRLADSGLPRVPSFGDYAIQHPSPPHDPGGPGMRANVRYTTATDTLVARGVGPVYLEGNAQYRRLCRQIVDHGSFEDETYSWGDRVVRECAEGTVKPRAQRMWRGAGTSHHIECVTRQLREHGR
jgi:hypothetical protein